MRGSSSLSTLLQLVLMPLPWSLRRPVLNGMLGFRIDKAARVGFSLLRADQVSMAPGACIGHLNMFKNIAMLKLAAHAHIGNLNWVSGIIEQDTPFFHGVPRLSMLQIDEHSSVTNRHYLDCIDKIHIGAFTTVAGFRSQILTHSLDLKEARQSCAPVSIGRYCFVGTGAIILGGASLADHCVLAAGSMLRSAETQEYCLLSGVPAVKVRDLERDWKYFQRTDGFIF